MYIVYNSLTKKEEKVNEILSHHFHRNTKLPLISPTESVQSDVVEPTFETAKEPVKRGRKPKN